MGKIWKTEHLNLKISAKTNSIILWISVVGSILAVNQSVTQNRNEFKLNYLFPQWSHVEQFLKLSIDRPYKSLIRTCLVRFNLNFLHKYFWLINRTSRVINSFISTLWLVKWTQWSHFVGLLLLFQDLWSVSYTQFLYLLQSLLSNRHYCLCIVSYKTSLFLQSFSILIYRSFILWLTIGLGEFLAFFTLPILRFKSFNVFSLCFECRPCFHPNTALYLI